jgi:LysR family transcriptional regulator, regulator for genes of the gallate degradation pathway
MRDGRAGRGPDRAAAEPRGLEHHLRCIRDFLSVAETGSIAKSSDATFKAASAITRAIAELEACFGVALFERKPRGMLLNAYGVAVRHRALRIADEIAAAVDATARPGKRNHGVERNVVTTLLLNGRGLRLLISLADLRNLSAAASHLGLSQAGASMSLSRMEAALGQPLFHRMTQGMIATDAGARIVTHGRRIFAELRHMRSDVAAIAGTVQGSVIIGALPLGRTDLLPTAIAAALGRHPELRVTTVESPYEALVAGLRDGTVDFILGALRAGPRSVGLTTERLFEDRLSIVVRAGHPLAGARSRLRDLLRQRWILPRPGTPARGLIDLSFRELAIEPPVPSVETGDLAVLRGLLRHSDMVTAISPHQLLYEFASGDLVELAIDLEKTVRPIGITARAGAVLSPAAQAVLDEIRTASRSLPGR